MIRVLLGLLSKVVNKTITYQEIVILSDLLWSYHKKVAISHNIQVGRGGWFMDLITKYPRIEYQRGIVNIYKDILAVDKQITWIPDMYINSVKDFINSLNGYIKEQK